MKVLLIIISVFLFQSSSIHSGIYELNNEHLINSTFKSWYELKFNNIIKQKHDNSCGAASLATLLKLYKLTVTEDEILDLIKNQGSTSFLDLKHIAEAKGFFATGVAVSFDTLLKLKIPVIIHLRTKYTDHFTVLTGIHNNFFELADPSWGNVFITHHKFKKMYSGKLLILNSLNDISPKKIKNSTYNLTFTLADF
ncbi:MAG: peptidase C39 [Rickettsiales bacterium]|nr:peptidase C39 [Rickettsiales bacterium]